MAGIDRTEGSQPIKTAFEKKDSVNTKKQEVHSKLLFNQQKIKNLEDKITDIEKQLKNFKAITPEQDTLKTQMETLLELYKEELKELKDSKDLKPKFGLG